MILSFCLCIIWPLATVLHLPTTRACRVVGLECLARALSFALSLSVGKLLATKNKVQIPVSMVSWACKYVPREECTSKLTYTSVPYTCGLDVIHRRNHTFTYLTVTVIVFFFYCTQQSWKAKQHFISTNMNNPNWLIPKESINLFS